MGSLFVFYLLPRVFVRLKASKTAVSGSARGARVRAAELGLKKLEDLCIREPGKATYGTELPGWDPGLWQLYRQVWHLSQDIYG